MAYKTVTGRNSYIGPTRSYPVPIQLEPLFYKGAIVLGDDRHLYYSDGIEWRRSGTNISSTNYVGAVPDVNAGGDPQTTLNTAFPSASQNDAAIDL
jgi:hypothetical protein